MAKPRRGGRTIVSTGPFKGVQNTDQPYDDQPDKLVDAFNCYIPDPVNGSEVVARPGMAVVNPSGPLSPHGQGVFTHVDLTGAVFNFISSGGKLYRLDSNLSNPVDVTPAGTPIAAADPRVYFTSFIGALIINDTTNRPWVATNLSATPVTRTPIDFDGAGTAWSAFGQPWVYGGSIFFIVNSVGGVRSRLDIAWSAPADPATGYQQTNYDFRWTLQQTGAGDLTGLCATNTALFYFRDGSIGAITGTPGPDLQQTATHDAIAVNVGTLAPATIQLFGDNIFFCDVNGKPWMMSVGGTPVPIWLQLRSLIEQANSGDSAIIGQVACATILSGLNLYLAAIWAPVQGVVSPPIEIQAFDAKTGAYVGRWGLLTGTTVEAIGILNNTAGRGSLVIVGSQVAGANPAGGYIWSQNAVMSGGIALTTEDLSTLLVDEAGNSITTENVVPSWLDNDTVPIIQVVTQRLGYSGDSVWNVDSATIITGSASPCSVTLSTTTDVVLEGTPTPSPSQDRTYRLTVGADAQGRGVQIAVRPTTADTQWKLYSASATMLPSLATADEP
jgi:hypothetical protein